MHVDSNCAVDMLLQSAIDVRLFAKDAKKAIPNSSNSADFTSCRLYYYLHLKNVDKERIEVQLLKQFDGRLFYLIVNTQTRVSRKAIFLLCFCAIWILVLCFRGL